MATWHCLKPSPRPVKGDPRSSTGPLSADCYRSFSSAGCYDKSTPQIDLPFLTILWPHSKYAFKNINSRLTDSPNIVDLMVLYFCLFFSRSPSYSNQ